MSKIDYDIKVECPNCGEVHIRSKNFLSASYDKSGWICVSFGCPTCDAAVEFKSNLGTQNTTELSTQLVSKMTSLFASANSDNKDGESGDGGSDGGKSDGGGLTAVVGAKSEVPNTGVDGAVEKTQTLDAASADSNTCVHAQDANKTQEDACNCASGDDTPEQNKTSNNDANTQNPSSDKSPLAKQENKGKVPLNISYMAVGNNPMMTFGVQLDSKQKASSPENAQPRTPTEEDKARIEYFHRQLESLDTVDDAIDEIETGYHLHDKDEDDE